MGILCSVASMIFLAPFSPNAPQSSMQPTPLAASFFAAAPGFFEIGYADDLRRFAMNGCRILGIYEFAQDEIRKFHFDPPFFVNGIKGEACQSSSCSIAVI